MLVKAGRRVFIGEAATRAKSPSSVQGEDAAECTKIEATEGDATAVKVTHSEATVVEIVVEATEIEATDTEATEGEAPVFEISGGKAVIETTNGEVTEVEAAGVKASVVPIKHSPHGAPLSPLSEQVSKKSPSQESLTGGVRGNGEEDKEETKEE